MSGAVDSPAKGKSGVGYTRYAVVGMFILLLAGYTVNAMDRQVFPVLLVAVKADFGFSATQAGLQSTIFSLGIGVLGLPVGYFINHVSRKWTVVTGTAIFSIATALTTLSTGFWDMTMWRVLSGVGESLQFTSLIAIAAVAFPLRRGMAIGTINICFALGALIGPALGGALLDQTGQWRVPEILFAILGGILAVAIAIFVRPWLTERRSQSSDANTIIGGSDTLMNSNTIVLIIMTVLGGLVDFAFLGEYATFLESFHHYSAGEAGIVMGLSGISAVLSFYGGHLGDRFSPRAVLGGAFALTGIAGAAVFLGPGVFIWQAIFAIVFGLAFSAGAFVMLAGFLVKSVSSRHTGTASGIYVTSMYIPAAFAGFIFSWLVESLSWGGAALVQIVLGSAIAVALSFMLKPSRFSTVQTNVAAVAAGTDAASR